MNISVVIPTYKKNDQLLKNLEINIPFWEGLEIIVVNDDPETSMAPVTEKFPHITIVQNSKNLGFAGAVNAGIQTSTGTHILLLNNDVLLHDKNYVNGLKHFEKDQLLFAVGFAQNEADGTVVGKNSIRWESGFIQHSKADDMKTGRTAWAEGGAALFDKSKLIEVGMFDQLFSPFYWEDTDLGYRAWKHGYTILFDQNIVVEHHHESTIASFFSLNKIKTVAYRNQFFFIWTNITDTLLINEHKSSLPTWLIKMALKGDFAFISGFLQAYSVMAEVRKMRAQKRLLVKKTDQEILSYFAQ